MIVERLGFTVLASGTENPDDKPIANVIFVHGLRGHPRQTWESTEPQVAEKRSSSPFTKWLKRPHSDEANSPESKKKQDQESSVFWPADLLPMKIPKAQIMTYGHDADVIGGPLQGANKDSITQRGRNLMIQLEREIGNTSPIIFVVHSLGGIIVKEGLQWSKTRLQEQFRVLHQRTRHIIFMGTPHQGSDLASMGKLVANFAAVALVDSNKALLDSLTVESEVLDRISDEFSSMLHSNDFTVHSFQEGRGMSGLKGFSGKAS
ncbi:MAG: hypothetical protein M1812_001114 [Candelaria pacifica]|nr:MAG: hypothetical protein M1812_001114 [Candelaria pacifica]